VIALQVVQGENKENGDNSGTDEEMMISMCQYCSNKCDDMTCAMNPILRSCCLSETINLMSDEQNGPQEAEEEEMSPHPGQFIEQRWVRSPQRFGKRAPQRFGKRAPQRFGKRAPQRFGKRLEKTYSDMTMLSTSDFLRYGKRSMDDSAMNDLWRDSGFNDFLIKPRLVRGRYALRLGKRSPEEFETPEDEIMQPRWTRGQYALRLGKRNGYQDDAADNKRAPIRFGKRARQNDEDRYNNIMDDLEKRAPHELRLG